MWGVVRVPEQILALAPELDQAMVVSARQSFALLFPLRLPEPVLVLDHREPGAGQGSPAQPGTQPVAELKVGEPVVAKLAVEAAPRQRLRPAKGQDVSLQRVDLGTCVGVKVTDTTGRRDAERPGHGHSGV